MKGCIEIKTKRKEKSDDGEVTYLNRFCVKVLRILGVLYESRKESSSFIIIFTKSLSIFLCYALLALFVATMTLHLLIKETNINVKFRKIPLVLYNVMVFFKYNCLLIKQKEIIDCIRYLENDLKRIVHPHHRDIIKSRVKYGKRFFIIICVFLHATVIYWRIFFPLLKGKIVTANNITIRPLPSAGYYFNLFDDQISPLYEVVYFLQCAAGVVTIYINIVICTLAVTFIMHACSQLEIFIDLLESIVVNSESEKENTNFKLAVAVRHHIRIRRFLRMIENAMNHLYFMDLFGCCGVLTFSAYCLMMDWNTQNVKNVLPYIVAFVSVTCQIFVFCFVGEQLTLQDEKVALKSCVLEWNRIPYKKAKNVIPIVILSNCRMKITAGSIIELSLRTFSQVMKTTIAYCNMMRTVMQ